MHRTLFLSGRTIAKLFCCSVAVSIALCSLPDRAAGATWCRALPVERAFCSVLAVRAPRGSLRLAVADSEPEREHGLMGVHRVPESEGMIFVFPGAQDERRDFWMKDTIAPLDMVFVGVDGTINDVAENVPATKPGTPDAKITRRHGLGRYVIELAAGTAERAGLEPGVRLSIPLLPAT